MVNILFLDIYCYICQDMKIDPFLPQHLETFGILISTQEKTEKSMVELVCIILIIVEQFILFRFLNSN
jgi:uncharacterized UBP type Zn finger protein